MKSVKVADYMATRLHTVTPETSAFAAMRVLLENGISGTPVVNAHGDLVGTLSEVDLMNVIVHGSYHDDTGGIVADYMQTKVETIPPDMDIYSLAELFSQYHRRRYPVVEDDRLVGQISRRDVLRAMREFTERQPAKS